MHTIDQPMKKRSNQSTRFSIQSGYPITLRLLRPARRRGDSSVHPLTSHSVDSAATAVEFGWLVKGRVQYATRSGSKKYDDDNDLSLFRASERRRDEGRVEVRATSSIVVERSSKLIESGKRVVVLSICRSSFKARAQCCKHRAQ